MQSEERLRPRQTIDIMLAKLPFPGIGVHIGAMEFRRAILSDAPALGTLHVVSWHETYTGIIPDEMLASLSFEVRTAMWSAILDDPAEFGGTVIYVAEEQGHIVGFGSCGQQRDAALAELGFSGEISAIYVLRSHQGLKVGR